MEYTSARVVHQVTTDMKVEPNVSSKSVYAKMDNILSEILVKNMDQILVRSVIQDIIWIKANVK